MINALSTVAAPAAAAAAAADVLIPTGDNDPTGRQFRRGVSAGPDGRPPAPNVEVSNDGPIGLSKDRKDRNKCFKMCPSPR